MGFSPELAVYFSRVLIGIEFALGFLLLFPFNLKKIVIPATIIMLAVFAIHLSIEILSGNNSGNCGCFGSLLPMTPLQALIKNILSIGLLGILLLKFSDGMRVNNNFLAITNITTACVLFLFMLIPIQKKTTTVTPVSVETVEPPVSNVTDTTNVKTNDMNTDLNSTDIKVEEPKGPAKKASGYAKYFPKIDKRQNIVIDYSKFDNNTTRKIKSLYETN
jgi:hypothetical protein